MQTWVKIALGAGLMILLVGIHSIDKRIAVKSAKEEVAMLKDTEYTSKLNAAKEATRSLELELQAEKDEAMRKKDEEIKRIDDKLNAVLSSLQFYKECSSPTAPSSNTKIGIPCPGPELSREDARILIEEAARADKLIKERDYYYERYENVRKSMEARTQPTP